MERHLFALHFFANQTDIGVGVQGDLQSDIGCTTSHQTAKMVVLLGAERIGANVPHQFGECAASRVESEADRDVRGALQISVDGLRDTNNPALDALALEILRKDGGVRVTVISAGHHKPVQIQSLHNLARGFHVLRRFDLVPAGTDHIESPHIAVHVHKIVVKFAVVPGVDPVGPVHESDNTATRAANSIVNSGQNVMAAGRLSATQHNSDLQRLDLNGVTVPQLRQQHVLGVREQLADLVNKLVVRGHGI
mmetsp:Transcript_22874/g.50196  ORF Transcript_22874/g.50196 Transcript_22874/m.50196 type:complete len:251 (-) Transcript_22874:175-927(-)